MKKYNCWIIKSLTSRWRSTLCGTSGLWSWPSRSTKTGSRTFFRTAWRRGSPTLWVRLQLHLFAPSTLIQDSWLPCSFCRKQGGSGRVLHVQRHVLRLCQQPPDLREWEEAQVRLCYRLTVAIRSFVTWSGLVDWWTRASKKLFLFALVHTSSRTSSTQPTHQLSE